MDWFELLGPLFEEGSYFIVFIVLVLCGVGLPIPEEITFILAGYVVATLYPPLTTITWGGVTISSNWHLWLMIAVGLVGLLTGDTLVYYLGKHYGLPLLKKWPFRKFIDQAKIDKAQKIFAKYGSEAVFFSGFFAGIRLTLYFLSGTMRVSYLKFIFWDFMRAVLTCPISIWLGWKFGKDAEEIIGRYKDWFLGAILCIVIGLIWFWCSRHKKAACPKSL